MTTLINLRKKHYLTLLFILFASFTFNARNVMAQAYDDEEEEFYDDEEYEDEEDEDEYEDGADLYENTVDIDDPNGMYKLDDLTAATFKQITSLERKNALMKLKIEQEKLKLDLKKQEAEKKKLAIQQEDEERTRKLKLEEQERKAAEARRKDEEALAKEKAEREKEQQNAEINRKISELVSTADLSDPENMKMLNQLLALSGGNTDILKNSNTKDKKELEDKFSIKSIVGAGGNLIANVENLEKKSTIKVTKGTILDGWLVESIKSSSILLKKDGIAKVMYLNQ